MSTRNRIPQLLEPYFRLPPELSLILLTGTLGCTPTWLTSLYVSSILSPQQQQQGEAYTVLLVSWMRDLKFWKTQIRRTTGLDLSKLASEQRFHFVDCTSTTLQHPSTSKDILESTVQQMQSVLSKIESHQPKSRTILILDNPDILLATASTTASNLHQALLPLRSRVHATIVSLTADSPFLAAAAAAATEEASKSRFSPVEVQTSAFVVLMAHAASFVVGVRELLTGAARDVSGVVRITRGGGAYEGDEAGDVKEVEALYLVQRDGGVKVFGRGQMGG
ncbi:hypothetical protein BDY17DRAFT_246791 [Neohortaea acidophila]|uniref:Elongator complex protein 6 n=1 Tax=Neohortaea acidophila TaxID=245834 RepID=A0A6A6Q1W8_9PEZI|nr:uncharacterized protein BDY17DRAFT_246791 [Neohortaea acidophila]KAF2485979.1 hypothetical protein BDY17DRAFT_246791 [Neohortaea acidophila]